MSVRPRFLRRRPVDVPLVPGNQVQLLFDGGPYFEALEAAIASAQSYVWIETYIFAPDATGFRIARALAERSKAGVEVALSYDGYGSLEITDELITLFEAARVKVVEYNPVSPFTGKWPWSRRNHRKFVIVDGRVAVIGGLNIGDDYASVEDGGRGWRDTGARIEGPAVAQLEEMFRQTWAQSGGDALARGSVQAGPVEGGVPVRFVGNFARQRRSDIRRDYLRAILGSTKTIRLMNAYFTPDRRMLSALVRAARRGVEVEIIIGGATDVWVILMVTRGLYAHLLKNGVRIYEWHERILHAKTAVIDGVWTTIGSANMNLRSVRYDLEANVTIAASAIGAQMDQAFLKDRARSRQITAGEWAARPARDRLLEWFFGLFRRLV
ncbi:MAG: phosphatidylserine/phosphatidylglycerophosphate/cardiolipin synthase family protein [Myxococcota bacterium]